MSKGILVVSFGTSYLDTLKNSIENVENTIERTFSEYSVKRAFTSHKIINKLRERHGIVVNTPGEALDEFLVNGIEEIVVQPLHLIPGEEFQYIKGIVDQYKSKFKKISLGRPIFYYQGIEDLPQDYSNLVKSISNILDENNATVLFGHGTAHPANASYGCLQAVLEDEGYDNVFVGTVEGYPNFNNVLAKIKKHNITEVTLVPLMVVCGDHAKNDMASDEEDSWKTMLENQGIKVNLHLKGLGEIDTFNELYIHRINDCISGIYDGVGDTKKIKHKKIQLV